MRFLKKLWGNILYGFAKAHSFVLKGLLYLIETGILVTKSFLKGCAAFLAMGGCLVAILLIGFIGTWLLANPIILIILVLIVTFPILGALLFRILSEYQEISSRYLFGRAEYLKDPDHHTKRSYKFHKEAFYAEKAEKARRENERRARQQREWEDRFRQWQSFSGGAGYGYGNQGPYGGAYSSDSAPRNPYVDFKTEFEKHCATLDVPVTADESRIKLAYRKKAKQYHPDVNPSPDATAAFQKISEAYEFLNADNIKRYKSL